MIDALRQARRALARVHRRYLHAIKPLDPDGIDERYAPWRNVVGPYERRAASLRRRIDHFRKVLGIEVAEPWWRPVHDNFCRRIHLEQHPSCKGRLRVTPWSGPGWMVYLCDRCDCRIEM